MLNHWHPLCPTRALRRGRPVGISLAGQKLVAFRTRQGDVGVLDDACPHRRMKLSTGRVNGECIVCPYHGWRFQTDGTGESPGTPKLSATATAYSVIERHGFIWVTLNSSSHFPRFELEGFTFVCPLEHRIAAPLELVLDNFTEVEHAASVHSYVGYDLDRMAEVTSEVEATKDAVRIVNVGPQKRIPAWMRLLYGITNDSIFHWEWTTRFSPVHVTYDEYWTDAATGKEMGTRARIAVFFCPIDERSTRLVTFASFRLPYSPSVSGLCMNFREIARQLVNYEMHRDARMIQNLADTKTDIVGMKLSRFDRPLVQHRERIARIYRGIG